MREKAERMGLERCAWSSAARALGWDVVLEGMIEEAEKDCWEPLEQNNFDLHTVRVCVLT